MKMRVKYGTKEEIGPWMDLVREVSPGFPGLETEECLQEHRETVLKFMGDRRALCVKSGEGIAGVLLFSRKRNQICCLAVSPWHRREGIASALLGEALGQLDRSRDITVSTFREEDEKGRAPRALYRKFGFVEGELVEEYGYPNQVFVLPRKGQVVMETERLILREFVPEDFEPFFEIVSDPETMQHYPKPFDVEKTRGWIAWNLQNYRAYGFGLWAVVLKETGRLIGDCGITMQDIDGEKLPEIGYHIHKKYWRQGFGSEAARAVRDWGFRNTEYDCLYSYMKYTNVGSYSTALATGMKKVKEYPDEKNGVSYAYAITRKEWELLKNDRD